MSVQPRRWPEKFIRLRRAAGLIEKENPACGVKKTNIELLDPSFICGKVN